jgi:hypothetical protein
MMICPTDTYSHKPTHHNMQQIILDMQQILEEVKHHDFYITYYRQLVDDSLNQFQIVNTLQTLAADAHLKVSFNHALGLCIFERNE